MFVVLALFLSSGCGGSSGGDIRINSNTNTNNDTGNTSLTFDSTSYTTGTANGVAYRAYSNITYVASPVNESYQKLSIYIPETYFSVRYIKYNASRLPAGNVNRIISCGTSAGGAISSLLGATGNSPDYDTWLEELGAADVSDDIYRKTP